MERFTRLIKPATQIAYPLLGIEKDVHDQLLEKSLQHTIVQHCPDDSQRRFASTEDFQKWSREVRTHMFCFLNGVDLDLAGIVFYRDKGHQACCSDMTMGVRVYDGYRGSGLGREMLEYSYTSIEELRATTELSQIREDAQWLCASRGVWLSVDRDNYGAFELYKSLGYTVVVEETEKNRIIMEYDVGNE